MIPPPNSHRHPIYWFDDGTVIVRAHENQIDCKAVLFRIHESLLSRHSNVVLERASDDNGGFDVPTMTIPVALNVDVQDFTSLLAHLYHDTPLSPEAPFDHVAAILRVSSPAQLDLPSVHRLARSYFVALFPSGPTPFVHPGGEHLEEALALAVRYDVPSIRKGIYYSLVTTTDVEPEDAQDGDARGTLSESDSKSIPTSTSESEPERESVTRTHALAPTDIVRCRHLMQGIVAHFTPVLFEPPVTPHMACTHVFADTWFPLVIQPAIAGDSVCKPLEALERLKQIDWRGEGVCAACVREKREEWTSEQAEVWEKMDGWLALDVVSD